MGRGLRRMWSIAVASGLLATGVAHADDPPPQPQPVPLQCYGNPPRQTEDPLSPPCVASFSGDNGGATWQGVTADRVNVVVTIEGAIQYIGASDQSNRATPSGRCFDLSRPPEPFWPEHLTAKGLRVWQAYFNRRFQTYHRAVFFTVCYTGSPTADGRKFDALSQEELFSPFAVVPETLNGNTDVYIRTVAEHGSVAFGTPVMPQSFYAEYPGQIWGFDPSVELTAENAGSYLCTKVVPNRSVVAGPDLNGISRKFGVVATSDVDFPNLALLRDEVVDRLNSCGGTVSATATFPDCCLADDTDVPDYALLQMADFKRQGITTVVWTGGINGSIPRAAAALGYFPEWIIVGDGYLDNNNGPTTSHSLAEFHDHAIAVTPHVVEGGFHEQRCYQAFRSENTSMPESDVSYVCGYYQSLLQLFTAIQVAGPGLTPANVDAGFHAILPHRSDVADVPSCYYLPGDYTCTKDAQAELWSALAIPPGSMVIPGVVDPVPDLPRRPGCWQTIQHGERHLNDWPTGNVLDQRTAYERCNGWSASLMTTYPFVI